MPKILRRLKIDRVDFVDRGASFDKATGQGAHILLFKRDDEGEEIQLADVSKPYPNEHAARIRDPKGYTGFRRKKLDEGVSAIIGFKEGDGSEVQAVRFDKKKFTPSEAKTWLKDHDLKPLEFEAATEKGWALTGSWEETEEKIRNAAVKLFNPGQAGYVTVKGTFPNSAVVCVYRSGGVEEAYKVTWAQNSDGEVSLSEPMQVEIRQEVAEMKRLQKSFNELLENRSKGRRNYRVTDEIMDVTAAFQDGLMMLRQAEEFRDDETGREKAAKALEREMEVFLKEAIPQWMKGEPVLKKEETDVPNKDAKFDLEKLDAPVRDHIQSLETSLTEVKQELETLKAEAAQRKKEEPPDPEEVLKSATPEVRQAIERMQAETADLRKRADEATELAKAERSTRIKNEFIALAKSFRALPVDLTKDVPVMIALSENSPEAWKWVLEKMQATDIQLVQAGALESKGTDGSEPVDTPEAKLDALAKKALAEGRVKTYHQGYQLAMRENPELYSEHKAEKRESRRIQ